MLVHPLGSAPASRRSITKDRRRKSSLRRGDAPQQSWRCKCCGDYNFHPNRRCGCCGAFPCGSYTKDMTYTDDMTVAAMAAANAKAAAKAAAVLCDILRRGGEAADAIPAALAPKIRAEPAASEAADERQVQRIIAWLLASPWELRKCKSLAGALAATAGALQHCSPAA